MSDAIQPPAASVDRCYRCDYDLTGIADDQACPECGLLAGRSRRVSKELSDSHPRWLRGLSRGVQLLILAVLIVPVWPFCAAMIERKVREVQVSAWRTAAQGRVMPPAPNWMTFAPSLRLAGFDLAAMLLVLAIWLTTRREGDAQTDHADRWRRRALRCLAIFPILSLLTYHAEQQHRQSQLSMWIYASPNPAMESYFETAVFAAVALITVGCVPLPLLLFRQLRSLAKRAHSAHLAEHCTIVGTTSSLALLYLAGILLIGANADRWLGPNWTARSNTWLITLLIMSVSAALIFMWSLYLLIRFAISFQRAASMLRRKWASADRSLAA
ncbi:hypothetical protein BH09PLA1_BH09PLA1_20040 [soil metagenome]